MVAKYSQPIPEILEPIGDKCVPLFIPDDPDYITALVEVLRHLTLDRTWQRDENDSAKVVRQQWLDRTFAPLLDAIVSGNDCGAGVFPAENNCFEYPSYAPFIDYSPQNPFNDPNLVPSGYLTTPFTKFSDFPLVGWLSTWLPGFTESLTGYLPNDIIVDISSLPLSSNFQETISGNFPQIAITVTGNGVAELHMINFPLGGRAIITVDVQPNIADIFLGIFGNGEFSVELNRDILSLPSETVSNMIFEVEIDEPTIADHTIYITFLPTIDDSFIPINFGGGLRSVKLCGFEEAGVIMGITDLKINENCEIETFEDGIWTVKGAINPCITAITNPMQTLITNNANNIATNTNDIATNTNAINNIVTVDIPQINLTLSNHDNLITNAINNIANIQSVLNNIVTVDIPQINLTLSDILNRLNNLEINVGSGDLVIYETTRTYNYLGEVVETPTIQWVDVDANTYITINTTDSGITQVVFTGNIRKQGSAAARYVQLRLGNGTVWSDTVSIYSDGSFAPQEFALVGLFDNLTEGEHTFKLQWYASNGEVRLTGQFSATAWHIGRGYPLPTLLIDPLVTFDENTAPYTLTDVNVGVVGIGGYPNNCLRYNGLLYPSQMALEVDLGEAKQIDSVSVAFYSSDRPNLILGLTVDGVGVATANMNFGSNNTWITYTFSTGLFPLSGQVVRVIATLAPASPIMQDVRIDNIFIDTGGV